MEESLQQRHPKNHLDRRGPEAQATTDVEHLPRDRGIGRDSENVTIFAGK